MVITQGVERGDRQWSGRDRAEHGAEGARAGLEAGCRHHGANRGLALGRPHGSVAVRVLALDRRLRVIVHLSCQIPGSLSVLTSCKALKFFGRRAITSRTPICTVSGASAAP